VPTVSIRFYEELNDFLPQDRRKCDLTASFVAGCTVKALIEDLGVPHTEVDLILVNGESVDFSHRLKDADRISVYPVFETWNVEGTSKVRPMALRVTRFIVDVHLGKLARLLRMFGFDATFAEGLDDEALANVSRQEGRIILTRDRGLLKRRIVTHGYVVRSSSPRAQLSEILDRFDLLGKVKLFSRCMACNAELAKVPKDSVLSEIPPLVAKTYDEFSRCPSCARVFWRGTHWERMRKLAEEVLGPIP
jgi:uncharacterized protein with PIN domain/sulfur carrier protein ThiS